MTKKRVTITPSEDRLFIGTSEEIEHWR